MADQPTSVISRREDILEGLRLSFVALDALRPAADPYGLDFSLVQREPLDDTAWMKRRSLGIYDTTEREAQREGPTIHAFLNVVLEARIVLQVGERASTEVNRVLAVLQRRLAEAETELRGKGLLIKIDTTENSSYVEEASDRHVSVTVFITVTYRRGVTDPRKRIG